MHSHNRSIAALALLLTADCRGQATPGTTVPQEWSAPQALPGMPVDRLHRSPSFAFHGDTAFVAANVFPIEGSLVGPRPVYLARIPGGSIPAPLGDFQFVFPKIVASGNAVHLIWGEFDTPRPDLLAWESAAPMSIWHATLIAGTWSAPVRIFSDESLDWPRSSSNVTADDRGNIHIALWSYGKAGAGFAHLVRASDGWHAQRTPYQPPITKTAIDARGDTVRIAFVGISMRASDTTGVTIATSLDHGTSWTSAVAHRLGGRSADQLQFVRANGLLYLSWAEAQPRAFGRDTLRVMSLHHLLRPKQLAVVPLNAGTNAVNVAAGCGKLWFLTETLSQQPRVTIGTVTAAGGVTQKLLLPSGLFTALAASSRTVIAMLAVRSDSLSPARSMVMSRSACRT